MKYPIFILPYLYLFSRPYVDFNQFMIRFFCRSSCSRFIIGVRCIYELIYHNPFRTANILRQEKQASHARTGLSVNRSQIL